VTEIGLNEAQIDAGFEQMRGVGMAQGVDAGVFLHAALLQGGFEGALDTALVHRLSGGGRGHTRARRRRKKPDGMTVGAPVLAQQNQCVIGQRHIAIFVTLALSDVEHHPLAVNIADLQRDAFAQAQAA
jgi:hypothetical protein